MNIGDIISFKGKEYTIKEIDYSQLWLDIDVMVLLENDDEEFWISSAEL